MNSQGDTVQLLVTDSTFKCSNTNYDYDNDLAGKIDAATPIS